MSSEVTPDDVTTDVQPDVITECVPRDVCPQDASTRATLENAPTRLPTPETAPEASCSTSPTRTQPITSPKPKSSDPCLKPTDGPKLSSSDSSNSAFELVDSDDKTDTPTVKRCLWKVNKDEVSAIVQSNIFVLQNFTICRIVQSKESCSAEFYSFFRIVRLNDFFA